ncbi:hypothetical protein ACFSSA_04145 [Luteolibacter algae]|uniref:Nucleotide-diphospho-sugar transferase domain-containing protein n=1 Tax=Luteolibacter algae TaxID=454151 RepID=A0ABW5D547_9BACT
MPTDITIATWMYSPPKGDKSRHHQVGTDIGAQKVRNYYWRSVVVLFASAATHHPESRRVLLVNELPPEKIDGFFVSPILERLKVEIRVLKDITRPPGDYHNAWNTQFVVLDALQELSDISSGATPVLLLDSDCVFIRPLSAELIERIAEDKILRYDLGSNDDSPENGLSNRDLGRLAAEYDPPLDREVIRYAGGEIFCGRADILPEVVKLGRRTYEISIERHRAGLPKFNEEAHLLSYVYEVLGSPDASANDMIKRIWTDRGWYSNLDGSEMDLTIWHLPAEKKLGIIKAFHLIASGKSYPDNPQRAARLFHIKVSFAELIWMKAKGVARHGRNFLRNVGKQASQITIHRLKKP